MGNIWLPIIQRCTLFKQFRNSRYFIRTSVSLSFKILGDTTAEPNAPPILLLHGLLGSKRHWEGLGKTIQKMTKRSVVAVDLRNHGDSPHIGSHTYEELASDVLRLYKKMGIDRASMIGHSMGGRTAMCVSLMAPEKVAGILVVDISPVSTSTQLTNFFPKVMTGMKNMNFEGMTAVKEAKKAARRNLRQIITDNVTMIAVLSNINVRGDGTIGWTCNLDVLIKYFDHIASFPLSMIGKKYPGPALFVGGQLSEFIPHKHRHGMEILFSVRAHTLLKRISKLNCISTRSAVDLAHKIHGKSSAPPIIILHGLLGSKRNWESVSKRIAEQNQNRVIAVDLRNHGQSPHDSSHTYIDLASDVSQLMVKLDIENATVIGHSMGGRTAMILALTEPSKVTSLIVVDISPISTPGLLNDFFPRLMDVMKTVEFPEGNIANVTNAKGAARHKLTSSGVVTDEGTMSLVLMNVGIRTDKKIGWLCNIDALKKHFADIATFPLEMSGKQYTGPTLFIAGDKSNYVPATDLDKIRDFFPNVQLQYIPNVGHNVHAEDPNTFLKTVSMFMAVINSSK